MLNEPIPTTEERLRKIVRYTWILPGIVLVVVCSIFGYRWLEASRIEQQQLEEKQRRESEENRRAFENLGGNRFEILHFYALHAVIRRGESSSMCYGVSNAKTVKLEPDVARVWPSPNRCFDVSPRKDTTYTLTIENANGQTKTATLTLRVQ